MNRTSSRPSLLTRINESQSKASITIDRSYREAKRQESFVERYRGTAFDTNTADVVVERRETMSRGRSFVLVGGTAAIGLLGVLLATAVG
ncbi:MAG: hypothetical protein AB1Z66_13960 [Candidatus Limnocylindrales bacterium]